MLLCLAAEWRDCVEVLVLSFRCGTYIFIRMKNTSEDVHSSPSLSSETESEGVGKKLLTEKDVRPSLPSPDVVPNSETAWTNDVMRIIRLPIHYATCRAIQALFHLLRQSAARSMFSVAQIDGRSGAMLVRLLFIDVSDW